MAAAISMVSASLALCRVLCILMGASRACAADRLVLGEVSGHALLQLFWQLSVPDKLILQQLRGGRAQCRVL